MSDDFDPTVTSGYSERELREFSAFVDGELSEAERLAVIERLSVDPRAADIVASYRAQRAAMRALFADPAARTSGPCIVLRSRVPWWQRAALAACWVALGAGLALLASSSLLFDWLPGQTEFAQRASIAYAVYVPEVRHPVEVGAADEAQLMGWLGRRMNRPLSAPSLQNYGFVLVGGRLLPGDAGPAGQLMYENHAGARLTLYMTGVSKGESSYGILRDGNLRTFYWATDHMGYALSGQIAESQMRVIAIDVCGKLGGHPERWDWD
ncbi:anti-sigma factor [Burkholderia sp. Bp8963]|uniref:anti-sigma factor family protein n=1 Tax=Burkholderia sp. Bp8963 TaxID=2184547 RepID=UPI000F5B002E|nr:anti-sigma factor [Burkholderia sp. Bp8963]RQS72020.1 anti-sigma factor [Burkholderia sp. Bp8963]